MSLQSDLDRADVLRSQEAANASLTSAEVTARWNRRRLQAITTNGGQVPDAIFQALVNAGVSNPEAPFNDVTHASNKVSFEAALATLVADAASPTQAHVTTANTAYTAWIAADLRVRKFVA